MNKEEGAYKLDRIYDINLIHLTVTVRIDDVITVIEGCQSPIHHHNQVNKVPDRSWNILSEYYI